WLLIFLRKILAPKHATFHIQKRYATFMKTDNLRKYQLSFCVVCKNKEYSFKEGVICGLTKQKPKFQDECENYNEHKELLEERKDKIKQKIYDKYPKQNLTNKLLTSQYYKSSSEIKPIRTNKSKTTTTKYD